MRIALDVDGVLADATDNWLKLFKDRFNINLTKNDISRWDFWKHMGIKQEDFEAVFTEAWKRWDSVRETETDLSTKVDKIRSFGELDIVTGRGRDTIDYVIKWMSERGINFGRIVLVGTYAPKAHLDYNVFIDDSPQHADEVANEGKMAFLYHQPWNKNVKERKNLIRIRSLLDVSSMLERMVDGSGDLIDGRP